MKFLILSDVHGNIEALDAVLASAPVDSYDRLLVLGDLVGYGANPNEVVDRIHELEPDALIRGNHDKVSSGIEKPVHFNYVAAEAARWTLETLTETNRARVAALPQGPLVVDESIEVCHGTPYDEDAYVFNDDDAVRALDAASRRLCFFGHTHLPVACARAAADAPLETVVPETASADPTVITLDAQSSYLINPGSVGQPRDGDPRAAYATLELDANEVRLLRVPYRVDVAQQKIIDARLPESLAHRLGVGR